jgi:hypothetical protein
MWLKDYCFTNDTKSLILHVYYFRGVADSLTKFYHMHLLYHFKINDFHSLTPNCLTAFFQSFFVKNGKFKE